MKSMTGYGYSEVSNDSYILSCEIKTYNSRYLDVSFFAPPNLSCFEYDITAKLKESYSRGRIECVFRLKTLKSTSTPALDKDLLKRYLEISEEARISLKIDSSLELKDLLMLDGVLVEEKSLDSSFYEEDMFITLNQSIAKVEECRINEGKNLNQIIRSHIKSLEKNHSEISNLYLQQEEKIKNNLISRCNDLMVDPNLAQDRILSEVAILLVKYTIEEELSRLTSHIEFFNDTLKQKKPIGKRLDFLAQEMHREVNTIGSKNTISEISTKVINMKETIENIREQVRNVE